MQKTRSKLSESRILLFATLIVLINLLIGSMLIFFTDMKPSNMLVNTNGEVKICDFGVSIQVGYLCLFAIFFRLVDNLSL